MAPIRRILIFTAMFHFLLFACCEKIKYINQEWGRQQVLPNSFSIYLKSHAAHIAHVPKEGPAAHFALLPFAGELLHDLLHLLKLP